MLKKDIDEKFVKDAIVDKLLKEGLIPVSDIEIKINGGLDVQVELVKPSSSNPTHVPFTSTFTEPGMITSIKDDVGSTGYYLHGPGSLKSSFSAEEIALGLTL